MQVLRGVVLADRGRRWVALTALAFALGLPLGLASGGALQVVVGMMLVTPLIAGLAGASVGTGQWLALPRRRAAAHWWIPASAVGLGLGLTLGIVAVEQVGTILAGQRVNIATISPLGRVTSLLAVGALSGLLLGAAEAWVLRRAGGGQRGWVVRVTGGLAITFAAAATLAEVFLGGVTTPAGFVTFVIATGTGLGLVTRPAVAVLAPPPAQGGS